MSTTASPFMEHLNANVLDDSFQLCDSPSGSSTSEPHDEPVVQHPNNNHSLFYKLDPFMNDNLMYMQRQTSPPLSLSSPNITDPLLPQNTTAVNQNPNFWSGFNNAIPNLAKNFTDYLTGTSNNSQIMPSITATAESTGMQIRVLGVPQTGAKSRVETQIKLCIQLVTNDGNKVQTWSHLKLPEQMVARDKLKRHFIQQEEEQHQQKQQQLFLNARVICASDPSKKISPCLGCIQRERKRSQRRKENKIKLEEGIIEDDTTADEQKILLFNCSEIVDFSSGDTILPTRITCYCRHHNEKLGFCIYFELHDFTGKQIATGMTPPIMITDDHKSNKLKVGRKRPRVNDDSRQSAGPLAPSPPHHQQYPIQPRPSSSINLRLPIEHTIREKPIIQRLIPSEGPTYGGVEVTILGNGFRQGLTCMFGNVAAATTHFWSPNTLVCILPPAADPGTVVVSFKEHPLVLETQDVTLFTYFNENDRALMELALQVVGLKMTGKVEDAREIAMRIVQGGNNNTRNQATNVTQHSNMTLEYQVIQILQMMRTVRHVRPSDVSMINLQGHTMLHLASMMGFRRLTQYLIDLGCEVNNTDKNGFTALHYAAWFNHEKLVAVLLDEGNADPEISNRWNKKPIHLAHNSMIQHRLKYHQMYYNTDDEADSTFDGSDVDTSFTDEEWTSEESDNSLGESEDELLVSSEGLRRRHIQTIQYLDDDESTSHSAEEILDALPVHDLQEDTDFEDNSEKEMTWMQRTWSHFPSDNSFLQNIKNNIPGKTSDLKTIADHLLQLPTPTMIANMFGTDHQEKREEPSEQALAWYMALAYAMGAGSLKEEEPENDTASVNSQEIVTKRRDKRLFSFWVPLLCLMVIWLIFQFLSSNPNVVDTIIGISGFRRQYLSVH